MNTLIIEGAKLIIAYKVKKKFGQNFLKDKFYITKIIESMLNIVNKSNIKLDIIEIGPGLGDLSVEILEHFNLISYEIDSELYGYLKTKFPTDRFIIYNEDVLKITFSKSGWLHKQPYLLVSNLPYCVATKIIVNALKDSLCKGMIVMTQKEVAYKFCAHSGNKQFSALSVLSNIVSNDINIITNVPPSAFEPMPKVESTIFSIKKDKFKLEEEFETFLKESFSMPRKKLSKNLSHISDINNILDHLKIDSSLRPHQINTLQYHQIFNTIKDIYGRKQ